MPGTVSLQPSCDLLQGGLRKLQLQPFPDREDVSFYEKE